MDVGKKVKAAAVLAGVPLNEVAEALGMSASNFTTRLRTGKFEFDELDRIAKALGVRFAGSFIFPDGTEI